MIIVYIYVIITCYCIWLRSQHVWHILANNYFTKLLTGHINDSFIFDNVAGKPRIRRTTYELSIVIFRRNNQRNDAYCFIASLNKSINAYKINMEMIMVF